MTKDTNSLTIRLSCIALRYDAAHNIFIYTTCDDATLHENEAITVRNNSRASHPMCVVLYQEMNKSIIVFSIRTLLIFVCVSPLDEVGWWLEMPP